MDIYVHVYCFHSFTSNFLYSLFPLSHTLTFIFYLFCIYFIFFLLLFLLILNVLFYVAVFFVLVSAVNRSFFSRKYRWGKNKWCAHPQLSFLYRKWPLGYPSDGFTYVLFTADGFENKKKYIFHQMCAICIRIYTRCIKEKSCGEKERTEIQGGCWLASHCWFSLRKWNFLSCTHVCTLSLTLSFSLLFTSLHSPTCRVTDQTQFYLTSL